MRSCVTWHSQEPGTRPSSSSTTPVRSSLAYTPPYRCAHTRPEADDLRGEQPKDVHTAAAAQLLNAAAETGPPGGVLAFMTRGIAQLATFRLDDAAAAFDGVLASRPTNLVALVGKARVLYARKQYPRALAVFQHVLTLAPNALPDPRVGIGLCFWAMDQKQKARAAWQRSVEVVRVCPARKKHPTPHRPSAAP
jgi:tetratricopeptide (TPR) repeat protein